MTYPIEAMCAAAWNLKATVPWDQIPEAWKPFYRDQMQAAVDALLKDHSIEENYGS